MANKIEHMLMGHAASGKQASKQANELAGMSWVNVDTVHDQAGLQDIQVCYRAFQLVEVPSGIGLRRLQEAPGAEGLSHRRICNLMRVQLDECPTQGGHQTPSCS